MINGDHLLPGSGSQLTVSNGQHNGRPQQGADREGMDGISPRYIQDKISNALVSDKSEGCINPFLLLNEMEAGLNGHSLITREEDRKRFAVEKRMRMRDREAGSLPTPLLTSCAG